MRAARNAVKYDATVAGVAETTEAYAFQGVKWEGASADDADVFNQLARAQNLDAGIRAAGSLRSRDSRCGPRVVSLDSREGLSGGDPAVRRQSDPAPCGGVERHEVDLEPGGRVPEHPA